MTQTQPDFQILNGPSKHDLSVALFYGDQRHRVTLNFIFERRNTTMTGGEYEVRLNQVSREDGSGESWNMEGECRNTHYSHGGWDPVSFYYHSGKREGAGSFVAK